MPTGHPKVPSAISRVEFFCDDRRVGEALRSLVNIAIGAPSVQPVTNAKRKGNGLAAVSSGNLLAQFEQHLADTKPKEVTTQSLGDFCVSVGKSASSRNYLAKQAIDAKLIKRDPKSPNLHAVWFVLPKRKG
jgi:hypothetical protein